MTDPEKLPALPEPALRIWYSDEQIRAYALQAIAEAAPLAEGREESVWEIEARIRATPTAQRVAAGDHVRVLREMRETTDDIGYTFSDAERLALDAAIAALAASPPRGAVAWDEGSPCVHPRPVGMVYPPKPAPRASGYLDDSGVEWNAYDTAQMEAYARDAVASYYTHPAAQADARGDDGFNGDNAALVASIDALLSLDAAGALVPHGIGGHARALLTAAATRLPA